MQTTPTSNTLEGSELGTPCCKGQNVGIHFQGVPLCLYNYTFK